MATPTNRLEEFSAVKLALMAKQARAQLGAIAQAEPIAIIGIGCRFPGNVDSPESFWTLLRDGVDAVGPIPSDRWDVAALHDSDPAVPGKISATQGGFLEHIDEFDAAYFGILRREAERMDPQQRLFLEVAIESLDRAGLPRERLAGTATGVFVASYYNDYTFMQFQDRDEIDARTLTGTQHSVLANRLSHFLDLRGPSVSIDTACSSSLVAAHLACQSLRSGDSNLALAGGVSLMVGPETMMALSKVGFMSPTGRCRTFDAQADGFVRGEGCGVVVLKRLSDAIADNDRVLAVIRGSAVNQDGRSTVLSAPNGLAQQALVRDALAHAQLTPDRVGFVETHGTATPLGDPIEVEALAQTIGAPRPDGSLCYLGSVKANLGHLEAASGVAGLIKATLVLQHAEIPRQIHFSKLNPHLSLASTRLAVADQHRKWPSGPHPRVAAVSGFGVGGTNAHVLIEEAPVMPGATAASDDEPQLFTISAQSSQALRTLATRWIEWLTTAPETLTAIAASSVTRRSHYERRLAVVARSKRQMINHLQAFLADEPTPGLAVGNGRVASNPRVAFVFSGQGAQWARMGVDLAARQAVFRDVLQDIDVQVQQAAGWSLLRELEAPVETSRLDDTEFAQPAIFAVQVALAALWESWGVRPDAVIGHSVGEIAALHVAGVVSLDDAVRIVVQRARIMQRATGGGRMVATGLTALEAQTLVDEVGADLSIGAINAPRNVVLSGTGSAVERATAILNRRGVSHRALPVSYAFHSTQMAPFDAELTAAIGAIQVQPARISVYSTVTGQLIDHRQIDAAYFGRNVRQTVRFSEAMGAALDTPIDAVLEIAPHPVLAASVLETAEDRAAEVQVFASLRRERPAHETLLQSCAALYARGAQLDFERLCGRRQPLVDLPAYPWQRERFWLRDGREARSGATHVTQQPVGSLLGDRLVGDDGRWVFAGHWPAVDVSWLHDHEVGGRVIVPAVALLGTLHEAAVQLTEYASPSLVDFVIHRALVLTDSVIWTTSVTTNGGESKVELRASEPGAVSGEQVVVATATVVGSRAADHTVLRLPTADNSTGWTDKVTALYERFTGLGVQFGPTFRSIERWRTTENHGEGWIRVDGSLSIEARRAGLLDGALQVSVVAAAGGLPERSLLPVAVDRITISSELPARVRAVARVDSRGEGGTVAATVQVFGETDALLAVLEGVRFAPADAAADVGPYEIRWQPAPTPADVASSSQDTDAWIVLTDGQAIGVDLIDRLTAAGARCLTVGLGSVTSRTDQSAWIVGDGDEQALQECLADHIWLDGRTLRGIVHLWGVGDTAGNASDAGDWRVTGSVLEVIKHALRRGGPPVPIWLVTRGAQPATESTWSPRGAGLWGLASVATAEYSDLRCHVIDLDPFGNDAEALLRELTTAHIEPARVALRGRERYLPRIERMAPVQQTLPVPADSRLSIAAPGTLDALAWRNMPAATVQSGEVRLRVLASGVNFRDVLVALGMYPSPTVTLGAECAGLVEEVGDGVEHLAVGDTVFGFAPGGLATHVVVPAAFVTTVPAGISVDQAAALPVAFLTAKYGLERLAQIKRGTRLLVHAGAGGVGLAAIQVAQQHGAEVFATAGSAAKRERLLSLGVRAVFDSRSLSFADDLLHATEGAGVDVVLNSLAGEFIPASVRTLAADGWFLELGKRNIWSPEQMAAVRPDVHYRPYDLGEVATADPATLTALMEELTAALASGALRPLPIRTFPFSAAADAFRYMSQARHFGKLVLRAPQGSVGTAGAPLVRTDATYLITGGTGGLGMLTARWLVELGARHLVLVSRHGLPGDAQPLIDECRVRHARIEFRQVDVADSAAMEALIAEIERTMPPLRGVIHAAGTIDEGLLTQQTWPRWKEVLRNKAVGARVLDTITRPLDLDFFVLYSSASTWLGPVGQGAYAAANAELDAIAWARRSQGLPALSVGWGQWRDSGMAARMLDAGQDPWSTRGLGWMPPQTAFARLESLLRSGATQALVLPIDWRQFLSRLPGAISRSFFDGVAPAAAAGPASAAQQPSGREKGTDTVARWRGMPTLIRHDAMLDFVASRARTIIGLDATAPIGTDTPLKEVGLDSLMAVELRNVLTRALSTSLPATLLFDYPTVDAIVTFLSHTLQLSESNAATVAAVDQDVNEVAALSDEEAEALLLAELEQGTGQLR